MDTAHRRQLKHDELDQVGQSVEYATEHRDQMIKWGAVALVVAILAIGGYWYLSHQHNVRQEALRNAMQTFEAGIGQGGEFIKSFPTQEEKDKAVVKELTDVATKYSGKQEGQIARYFLGLYYSDKGNLPEAEKQLKIAAEGKDAYASQAKLSLSQLYASTGRQADAEKHRFRSIVDDPTVLVSKEQATIALAKVMAPKNPAEARKLLEPLRSERGPVSRAAITALGEIPAAK